MSPPNAPPPSDDFVREFVAAHRLRDRVSELDLHPEFPSQEFAEMGRARLLGLTMPTALGGRALSLTAAARTLTELGSRSGSAFAKLALQPEFSSVIAEKGSSRLVDEFFRPLMRGEMLIGNQVTEPLAGSDVSAIRTTAERRGNTYLINGEKSQAAFAVDAAAAVVYARTGPPDAAKPGITALVVRQDAPGIERRVVPDLGERWMRRGSVKYHNVAVPVAYRIGEEGMALSYLKDELRRERALLGAIYLGIAKDSWRETVDYVASRTAFGGALSQQQGISFPLVEDGARLEAAELLVTAVLQRLDAGTGTDADAARAKWLACEVALGALDHAIQFHGGAGYSKAYPHEQRWRDVRSGMIAHGASEVLKVVATRELFPRVRPTP